jgi:Family of unknown function (DUF6169)
LQFYKYAPGTEPNTFIFPTDTGWLYSVAFINNSALFAPNELLVNKKFSFEIIFGRSKLDKGIKGKDEFIAATIKTILYRQFEALGEIPIYFFLCDMTDKRAAARSVLFNKGYESYDLPAWELINYELQDPDDNTVTYHVGLFIHSQHPNYKLIPDAFEKFLKEDVSTGKLVNKR